ncbi:MAG: SLC13 family permease [Peptococcaceae bacterium]|nr:SLC13 family permease [Peptococcaceae bacterium]
MQEIEDGGTENKSGSSQEMAWKEGGRPQKAGTIVAIECAAVVLVGVLIWFYRLPDLSPLAEHGFAVLALTIGLWITEVVPAAVAGLLFMVLLPLLKVAPPNVAFAGMTAPVLWLILAGLLLGVAVDKTGLARRLAYWAIIRFRADTPFRVVVSFVFTGAVLTFVLPTVVARVAVLIPVTMGLVEAFHAGTTDRISKFLMTTMFLASQSIMMMVMTSIEPNLVAVGLLARQGIHVSWGHFFLMWSIPALFLNTLIAFVIPFVLYAPVRQTRLDLRRLEEEQRRLGPVSADEKKMAVCFAVVLLLWATSAWTNLNPAWVGVLAVTALFVPGVRVLSMGDVRQRLNLMHVFFLGAVLSIAAVMKHVALTDSAVRFLDTHFAIPGQGYTAALGLTALVQVLHLGLSDVTSFVASVMPIFLKYAAIHHLSQVWVAWVVLAASLGFLLPYQAAPILIIYSLGYLEMRDVLKIGALITLATLVLVPFLAVVWWSWAIPLWL